MSEVIIDEPPKGPDEKALEKKVDEIISDDRINIFRSLKTAPEVSLELLKKINSEEVPKPEVVVKLDQASAVPGNKTIDEAIEDIVAHEGDLVLEAEDKKLAPTPIKAVVKRPKLKSFFRNKWLWIGLITIIIATFAVPMSRYAVLGLVLKHDVTVSVYDSVTNKPVSNALVVLHSKSVKTNANGMATIKAPVGTTQLTITKQYFKNYSVNFMVGYKSSQTVKVSMVATGRQVPITVVDAISGKLLAGAKITVLDTTASTDSTGQANVVLPTMTLTEKANVSLPGYNSKDFNIQITDTISTANNLSLVPAGSVYFLSNLSGQIDLIKANLDGSDRQSVFAGTGKEDPNNTTLLASRDWHYLVMKAQHDTTQPSLYLIDTSNDKVTNFDSGNADFNLIGWSGHNFLYDATKSTGSSYQAGHESLKSYDADNTQLNLLDQSLAEGSTMYQSFYNFNILSNQITYNTAWNGSSSSIDLSTKSDTIRGIQITNQTKKDYLTISAAGISYIQAVIYKPQGIYYSIYKYSVSSTVYYSFDGQIASIDTSIDQTAFNKQYPTYFVSPSGNQLFWSELRDGKNYSYIGNQNAGSAKQLTGLSDYKPYGWFGDNYILVTPTKSSELDVAPVTGISGTAKLLKISDYYKSYQSYNGYSYGG